MTALRWLARCCPQRELLKQNRILYLHKWNGTYKIWDRWNGWGWAELGWNRRAHEGIWWPWIECNQIKFHPQWVGRNLCSSINTLTFPLWQEILGGWQPSVAGDATLYPGLSAWCNSSLDSQVPLRKSRTSSMSQLMEKDTWDQKKKNAERIIMLYLQEKKKTKQN